MKLFNLKTFLPVLALLCCCACHDKTKDVIVPEPPTPEPQVPEARDITILVYHPYCDASMTRWLTSDYADILKSVKASDGLPSLQLLHFSAPTPNDAYLIETRYNAVSQEFASDTLKKYQFATTNYTMLEGLQQVISDVKFVQKADMLGMVMGGHASGWIPAPKVPKRRAFGSGGDPRYYNPTYKTNFTTLAEAIQSNGIKLEFLVIDNCYSQNIENAYDLRDATKYILASATEIMDEGIPYAESFHSLVYGEYEDFCDAFVGFYKNYSSPCATFSIVDCSKFEKVVKTMVEINSRYAFDFAKTSDIQYLGGLSSNTPFFFDFKDYVGNLCQDTGLMQEFSEGLEELVPLYYYTDQFFWYANSTKLCPIKTFCGISCSDPCTALQRELKETAWYKATHLEREQ